MTQCVNPIHLEAVTPYENNIGRSASASAINARKTHCVHGHEFTPENTYVISGKRRCKTCFARVSHNRYLRRKAAH